MAKQKLTITFTPETGKHDETFSLGAFAQIAAKRQFGLDVVKSGDPEALLFGAYVELEGPAKAQIATFDAWLQTVASFDAAESEDDPEDPSTAESLESSPASPPT